MEAYSCEQLVVVEWIQAVDQQTLTQMQSILWLPSSGYTMHITQNASSRQLHWGHRFQFEPSLKLLFVLSFPRNTRCTAVILYMHPLWCYCTDWLETLFLIMFFYSARPRTLSLRRSSVAPQGSETRIARQIAELIARQTVPSDAAERDNEKEGEEEDSDAKYERNVPIRSSSLANPPRRSTSDTRRGSKPSKYYHRRPTVTIQSDGRIIIGGCTFLRIKRVTPVLQENALGELLSYSSFGGQIGTGMPNVIERKFIPIASC